PGVLPAASLTGVPLPVTRDRGESRAEREDRADHPWPPDERVACLAPHKRARRGCEILQLAPVGRRAPYPGCRQSPGDEMRQRSWQVSRASSQDKRTWRDRSRSESPATNEAPRHPKRRSRAAGRPERRATARRPYGGAAEPLAPFLQARSDRERSRF